MPETVVIAPRFRGPDASANGGYAAGIAARGVAGAAEVTLKVPPPLGRELTVVRDAGEATLLDGDLVVAVARPTTVADDVPPAITLEEARLAASRYPWRDEHPYPSCFVCGPRRSPGDGLCIFPGPVEGRELYAAPWIPDTSLADANGNVHPEFVWAALDCPSGIVTDRFGDVGRILLGRLAVALERPVVAGTAHVVQAWPVSRDGRKLHTASALFTAAGERCGHARAVWIVVPPRS